MFTQSEITKTQSTFEMLVATRKIL